MRLYSLILINAIRTAAHTEFGSVAQNAKTVQELITALRDRSPDGSMGALDVYQWTELADAYLRSFPPERNLFAYGILNAIEFYAKKQHDRAVHAVLCAFARQIEVYAELRDLLNMAYCFAPPPSGERVLDDLTVTDPHLTVTEHQWLIDGTYTAWVNVGVPGGWSGWIQLQRLTNPEFGFGETKE